MTRADVSVEVATEVYRPALERMLELNAHEFSTFDGRDVDEHGAFGYPYLELYWTESDVRRPYVIRCGGRIAGFALVRKGPPHTVAEFFVLRKYRRRGIGAAAAIQVLRTWPGKWAVHQVAGNDAATEFWRAAIPAPFTEVANGNGITQCFVTPVVIRPARESDAVELPEIERRSGSLFRQFGMDKVADDDPGPVEDYEPYVSEGRALVATSDDDMPIAFVLIDIVDGCAHIEQVSVDPAFGRRGIGSALLEQAAHWAREQGLHRVTLCTFNEVPWNRPFYEGRGYRPLRDDEVTSGLAKLRAHEAELGLDEWPRLCMARDL